MKIQILFLSSSTPKVFTQAKAVYTKGGMLVVREGDWLFKYPLVNVFSVAHKHGPHWGSIAHRQKERKKR